MKKLLYTPINPEILQLIQKIADFRQFWKLSADTQQDLYQSLQKTTIITSAGASTRIEGATLSDDEILKKLKGLKIQKITDRDEAEVAGYIDCKKYIFDSYADLPITEHTIRSLHQMMMHYLPQDLFPYDQRGNYKNVVNSVVRIDHQKGTQEIIFKTTPPGPQTETAMKDLIEDYNAFIHDENFADLEVIAAFIVKFLAIHPFRDGNGRISRLLTDLCLLKKGYEFCRYSSHEKIVENTKAQYYVALRQTQISQSSDLNPWLFYFLKTLFEQTVVLRDKMEVKTPGTLTDKENKVVKLIQERQPITIGFLERETGFKRVTLKAILARLKDRKIIVMEGERKGSLYRMNRQEVKN